MTRLRHGRTWAIAATWLLVLASPGFSQTPPTPKPTLDGETVCFAEYDVSGADALPRQDYEKVLDDLFHLTGQHINVANDAVRHGGVPIIAGAVFEGSKMIVGYVMPCNDIGGASSALLQFLNRGTPRTKLPASVKVKLSNTRGEVLVTNNALQFPDSGPSQ